MSRSKPYIRPIPATWWLANGFFIRYMLREATALFVGGYSLVLLWGVSALKQGEAAWHAYLLALRSPVALVFQVVALGMALYHSVTWFTLAPKAMSLRIGDKKVSDNLIQGGHYVAFSLTCVLVILFVVGVI